MRTATALLLLLTGCSFGFENSGEVIGLRVLAIRSEPAELIANGPLPATVTVSALVVDPTNPSRTIPYEWRVCVPGASTGSGGAPSGQPTIPGGGDVDASTDMRCPEVDGTNRIDAGTKTLDALSLSVPVPPGLAAAVAGASDKGLALSLYVNAQLRVDDDGEAIYALKRVPISPDLPAGRVANNNPELLGLLFDGEPWDASTPLRLSHGGCDASKKETAVDRTRPGEEVQVCGHKITPLFDEDSAESYTVRTFDGGDLTLRERLRFAWFVEHGSLTYQSTEQPGNVGAPRTDPLSTTWLEPPARPQPGSVALWIVVRDGRGGASWLRREVVFE